MSQARHFQSLPNKQHLELHLLSAQNDWMWRIPSCTPMLHWHGNTKEGLAIIVTRLWFAAKEEEAVEVRAALCRPLAAPVVAGVVCCSYWSRSRMTWCCLYTLLVKMIMGCYMGDNYTMLYSTVFPLNYIIIRHRLPRSLRQSLPYRTRLHNL